MVQTNTLHTRDRNRDRDNSSIPSSSSSNSKVDYDRLRRGTKAAIKKFGPLLVTGLAAVVEHHLLKKDEDDFERSRNKGERTEERERSRRECGSGDNSDRRMRRDRGGTSAEREGQDRELQDLRIEVGRLRGDLNMTGGAGDGKGSVVGTVQRDRNADWEGDRGRTSQPSPGPETKSSNPTRPPTLFRDPRALHDEFSRHAYAREEAAEDFVQMPFAPTPPLSFPPPSEVEDEYDRHLYLEREAGMTQKEGESSIPRPSQRYDPPSSLRVRDSSFRASSSSSSSSTGSSSFRGDFESRNRDKYKRRDRYIRRSRERGFQHSQSRKYFHPLRHHRRHHRHHHTYLSRRVPRHRPYQAGRHHPHNGFAKKQPNATIVRATKVAAAAGLMQALYADGSNGAWIGRKGVRVGTAVAAGYAGVVLREGEGEGQGEGFPKIQRDSNGAKGSVERVDKWKGRRRRMRDVFVDVGTGVLVSRLVFGKVDPRGEENSGRNRTGWGRRRRWWSYWL